MATTLTARVRRHILDVTFTIDVGRNPVTVLFGPSGAGKTTLLRCLAGLDRPERDSHIQLGDEVWDGTGLHVPTRRRHVGYLFQDHALFPHLSVAANVGYGLHGLPRNERPARVAEALDAAGVAHLSDRPARGLSGGEAQRVALARALAPRPRLLLLDEPLSSLDAPTRNRLRTEVRQVLLASRIPTIVVTHDRTEALTLGDHIVVLIAGRLHQAGSIDAVFNRPATTEVAAAVGVETVISGQVTDAREGLLHVGVHGHTLYAAPSGSPVPAVGDRVLVGIRAEDVALELPGSTRATSPRNHFSAVITAIVADGPLLRVSLEAGFPLTSFITRPTRDELQLRPGSSVTAAVKASSVHLIPHPDVPGSASAAV